MNPRLQALRLPLFAAGLALVAACSPQGEAVPAADAVAPAPAPEAAIASAPSGGAPAADRLGHLTVHIDGTSTTYETLPDRGRDRPASAIVRAMGPMSQVQLQAHLPGAPMKQASLNAGFIEQGGSYQPSGQPELHVFPEGMQGPGLLTTSLEVAWDRLELGPDGGHVAGTFTGTACELRAATLTDEGCVPVEGRFDSRVVRVEL